MTSEDKLVVEVNDKADGLANDGVEVDGGAMAAVKSLTTEQLRKDINASIEYAAHFHVKVEEWKDKDELVPKRKRNFAFLRMQ